MKLLRWTPLLALLCTPLAQADVFHSEFVPGQCLGNRGGQAALLPCGPATKLQFSGYGAIRLAGQCLGSVSNPKGTTLRWETCQEPPLRAGGACRNTTDQCWAVDAASGRLNNEDGWAADIENERRESGAGVVAWDWQNKNNQKWTFRNLISLQQATSTLGLNPIGGLQLRQLDSFVSQSGGKAGNAAIVSLPGGNYMVAAGGGNMVAAGGGNMVAAGGGNMVAAGGGNLVAAGGGNLLNLNNAALSAMGGPKSYLENLARLVGNDGASLVGNDGASLIGNDGSTLTSRLAGYFSKQQNMAIAASAASMVAAGGGNLQASLANASSTMNMSNMLAGGFRLQSAEPAAGLSADKIEALARVQPLLSRVTSRVQQMRGEGKPIPPAVTTQGQALRKLVMDAAAGPSPLPAHVEPEIVALIGSMERALSQPVAAAPSAPLAPLAPPAPVAPPPLAAPPAPVAPPPFAPPPPVAPPPVMASPAQPAAPGPLAAGPCGDPWVNDTVAKTLNRPARGSGKNQGECNIGRYGNGSWSDYPDLLRKTQAAYGACGDKWVSAAVWEVLGRAPQGSGTTQGDCNNARYANGRWGSYDELVTAVRQAQMAPTAPAAPPVAAAPAAARMVSLRSTHAPGKCMAPAAGGGFILWDCVDNPNQRFAQEPDGSLKQNNQCLGASGNNLRLEPCSAQALHQKWHVDNGALRNGNVPPSCIDLDNGSKNNGARLQAWSCHGGSNQKWSLQP